MFTRPHQEEGSSDRHWSSACCSEDSQPRLTCSCRHLASELYCFHERCLSREWVCRSSRPQSEGPDTQPCSQPCPFPAVAPTLLVWCDPGPPLGGSTLIQCSPSRDCNVPSSVDAMSLSLRSPRPRSTHDCEALSNTNSLHWICNTWGQ